MYQSGQFHTSNYRGNQPGHDEYLRSDSQNASSFAGGQNMGSQYRGMQKTFQPTGMVQSVYGQNNQQTQGYGQMGGQNSFMNQNTQSFHTANYRGDQPGHDNYLRSDSQSATQSGYGMNQQYGFKPSYGFSGASNMSSYGQGQQQQQFVSPESYHTANYKGNQPGHDSFLRSDSTQPGQSQYGQAPMGYTSSSAYGMSGQGMSVGGSFMQQNQQNQQNQFVSPNSFHTANYRGDQQGHDNYLRSDSSSPQSQANMGFNNFGTKF